MTLNFLDFYLKSGHWMDSELCVHVNDRIKCVYLDYVSDFMDFHGFDDFRRA